MKNSQIKKICILILAIFVCGVYYFTSFDNENINKTKQLGDFQSIEGAKKTGTVTSASKEILTLETVDGVTYSFSMEKNTNFDCPDENLGDVVSVEYEGEYTDYMLAKKVSVTEEAEEDSALIPKRISDAVSAGTPIHHIAGIATDSTKNYIVITDGSETFTIYKDEFTITEDPLTPGDSVRIYYTQTSDDSFNALNIKVISPKPEKPKKTTKTPNTVHYITGNVIVSENLLIVIEKDNCHYRIPKSDNIISDSIQTGDTVRLYYTGSFLNGMTASCIEKISE